LRKTVAAIVGDTCGLPIPTCGRGCPYFKPVSGDRRKGECQALDAFVDRNAACLAPDAVAGATLRFLQTGDYREKGESEDPVEVPHAGAKGATDAS